MVYLSENAFGKNIYKNLDNSQVYKMILKSEIKDKFKSEPPPNARHPLESYITGALPTLVEILLRHTNETKPEIMYFLTMDEFDFYRKNVEETAKKNW